VFFFRSNSNRLSIFLVSDSVLRPFGWQGVAETSHDRKEDIRRAVGVGRVGGAQREGGHAAASPRDRRRTTHSVCVCVCVCVRACACFCVYVCVCVCVCGGRGNIIITTILCVYVLLATSKSMRRDSFAPPLRDCGQCQNTTLIIQCPLPQQAAKGLRLGRGLLGIRRVWRHPTGPPGRNPGCVLFGIQRPRR